MLTLAGVAFAAIAGKLTLVQLVDGSSYQRMAYGQEVRTVPTPAVRGAILSADGADLAFSQMRPTVFADPGEIRHAAGEARALARVLHRPAARLEADLTEHTTYVVVAGDVTDATATAVDGLALPGVGIEHLPVRHHPDGDLAGPVLGTVGASGAGVSGLEYEYNRALTGKAGRTVEVVDPQGQPVPDGVLHKTAPHLSSDVLTTLHAGLQYQVHQVLAATLARTHAASATAVVEDVHTGAIVALGDLHAGPHGTAVQPGLASALTSVYQPGSVAKLVTVAGALSAHVIGPRTELTIPPALPVAGTLIHDAEAHPTEQLSVTGVLAQSSNIGASEIGERLGARRLLAYERAFGFGRPAVPGFPGESAGILPTLAHFSGTTVATMSFGEAQAVTAAQLAAAYATIAAGGVYHTPHLVQGTVGPHGHEHRVSLPPPRRVVPASVSAAMTPMLEQVVASGTGTAAKVHGYAIAGKTGTSNVVLPDGKYSSTITDATFAGYYPAQHPQLAEVVVVKRSPLYGAQASAPAFAKIARDALDDFAIPSAGPQPPPEDTAVPTVNGKVETSLLGA